MITTTPDVTRLLLDLKARGVQLTLHEGRLRLRSPDGPLPIELKERLRACKTELIQFLSGTRSQAPSSSIGLAPVNSEYRLSFGQERLWYLDRYENAGAAYNMPTVLNLLGSLDVQALALGLADVLQRHGILRTTFREHDGVPYQVVDVTEPPTLQVIDLRAFSPATATTIAQNLASSDDQLVFDLEQGPICRFRVVLLTNSSILLANHHHIAADGWSLGIFFSEWFVAYSDRLNRMPLQMPALPIQYTDFAFWQRQRLEGEAFASQLDYWQNRLEQLSPLLELPCDRPRPARQTFHGATLPFTIPKKTAHELQAFTSREGTTLFTVGLTAFFGLLARLTRRQDIAVGTPLTSRPHTELEGLVGFFVNTLVVRAEVREDDHFNGLLKRTKDHLLNDFAHSDLPFEHLVEALRPIRDPSHPPLIQVMFSSQSGADDPQWLVPGLQIEPQESGTPVAKFDLTLGLFDEVGHDGRLNLSGAVEYNTDLFDAPSIQRFIDAYVRFLDWATTRPDDPLNKLPLNTAPAAVFVAPNEPMSLVPERVANQVVRDEHALAIAYGEIRLSYGELHRRADCLAALMIQRGALEGQIVAVGLPPSADQLATMLAVWKAGCTYLPMDMDQPSKRLAMILDDAGPTLLVTSRDCGFHPHVDPSLTILFVEEATENAKLEPGFTGRTVFAESIAYLIYTSGSSGRPKGVEISQRSLAYLVDWHCRAYDIRPADRASVIANSAFDASVWEIWPHLCSGASLHLLPRELRLDPPRLLDWLHRQQITIAFLPTPLAEALLRESMPENLSLRALLTGGDQLRQRPPQDLAFDLFNHYGPTEVTVVTTVDRVAAIGEEPGLPSIGCAVDHLFTVILEANGFPVLAGVPGELFIGGQALAQGYRQRASLTASRFVPDPFSGMPGARLYRSGDLVRRGGDGRLFFLGRIDQQVQLRGFRVELGEVEAVLSDLPEVAEIAVAVKARPNGSEQLVAYIVLETSAKLDEQVLLDQAAEFLPSYMVPTRVVVLDELPLTANGKLDRVALPVPAEVTSLAGSDRPADECEQRLANIWCELLELDEVGRHDNFFALGGHSLLAVRLLSMIRQEFTVDLPLTLFSQQPEIAAIASWLQQPRLAANTSPLVPLREGGSATPIYLVHAFDGQLYGYLSLVRALKGNRAIYGLAATEQGKDREVKNLPDLAALYVRALQKHQPQGPYLLAGWSLGGLIALEMAQQLTAKGMDVADLLLLDSALVQHERLLDSAALLVQALADRGTPSPLTANQLRTTDKGRWISVLCHEYRAAGLGDITPQMLTDLLWIIERNTIACSAYEPHPYPGNVTYFRASSKQRGRHGDGGWKKLARGGFRQYKVSGDHFSMVKLPHVTSLAKSLEDHLEPPARAKSWWRRRFISPKQT